MYRQETAKLVCASKVKFCL